MKTVLVLFLTLLGTNAYSQSTATLSGKVADRTTGEALIGANIIVVGTTLGTSTDVDGFYTIKGIPAGTYTVKFSYIAYQTKQITDVALSSGKTTRLDAALNSNDLKMDEVVVEASAVKNTEGLLLLDRKKSGSVVDAISAEQIKKSSDSDAGEVMKRVTGVSLVGGKFVYVRGLGERYSNTTLNGSSIPSPEPEKKVIPFDMFPSNLIQSMTTVKTFSPEMSGDFAGGSVQINTVEFPDKETIGWGVSSGFNSASHFVPIPTHQAGNLDFLGFDDGGRSLPKFEANNLEKGREFQTAFMQKLENRFKISNSNVLPNQGYNFTYGKPYMLGSVPVGVLGAVTYSNSHSYKDEKLFLPTAESASPYYDLNSKTGEFNTLWGALLNISARPAPTDKLSLKTLYNHSAERESRVAIGRVNRSNDGIIDSRRSRFVSRSLISSQLSGEHFFERFYQLKFDWKLTASAADRSEPDNAETIYGKEPSETQFRFYNNYGPANGRFFSDLHDNEVSANADLSVPFYQWNDFKSTFKFGGVAKFKKRDFESRRIQYAIADVNLPEATLEPEQLLTAENVSRGIVTLTDATSDNDGYNADDRLFAGYAMIDMPLTADLRLVSGVRSETNNVLLKSFDPRTGQNSSNPFSTVNKTTTNWLSSASLIYSVTDDIIIRSAFSTTLARPEFREFAPFQFLDYKTRVYGNPFLKDVSITNYDLRGEYFVRPGELFAVSLFYKTFTNPIEMYITDESSGLITIPVNADRAVNYGVEFESRFRLNLITDVLSNWSINTNLTLVRSETSFNPDKPLKLFLGNQETNYTTENITNLNRPLQGQSPYVVNVTLNYERTDWGFASAVLYNTAGERISEVGTKKGGNFAIQDIYEQPRHQLDFVASQKLLDAYTIKMSLKNILNDGFEFKSGDYVTSSYKTGMSASLSISYSF